MDNDAKFCDRPDNGDEYWTLGKVLHRVTGCRLIVLNALQDIISVGLGASEDEYYLRLGTWYMRDGIVSKMHFTTLPQIRHILTGEIGCLEDGGAFATCCAKRRPQWKVMQTWT